jgi:hypothetical protein
VRAADTFGFTEVRNGARDPQHTVVRARGESEPRAGLAQHAAALGIGPHAVVHLRG